MVPVSYTSTSMLTVTLFISSIFFLATNYLGIYKHSYKFITIVVPINVPILIKPFLFLIETISYLSRVFSLAIRLFANMLSGHILVKIIVKSL
jgi:F0F1-type ATP synthase membrane subunit a